MIDGLLGLFKHEDWRGQPRKNEPFPVAWLVADHVQKPGKGLEISAKDVVFTLQEKPPGKSINILLHIRNRFIAVRVDIRQENVVNEGGQTAYMFGCSYSGLKADDWDAIVRYVNNQPEPENKAADELKEIQNKVDDAYRIIPIAVQNKLFQILIDKNRLEPPPEGQAPPVRMNYLGKRKKADGSLLHRVSIHSRKLINIDSAGNIEQQG
jgi:hypothetical protein